MWSELQRKSLDHKPAAGHLKNLCALVVDCDQLRRTEGYPIPAQSSHSEHQRRAPVQPVTGALSLEPSEPAFVILCESLGVS
jgi:hypothetical protein